MWILPVTVLTASLLGSLHCVGMCGPLALWASGTSETSSSRRHSKSRRLAATLMYHLGRLSTYVGVGLLAGSLGSLANISGASLGIQLLAARIVGAGMVIIGLWQIYRVLKPQRMTALMQTASDLQKPTWSNVVGRTLVKLRPWISSLPLHLRGLFAGAVTPFLPCGWLYLFALVAAGTGSALYGGTVMAAFWLGTVPALTVLIAGVHQLSIRFRRLVPIAAALLLIVSGSTTFAGRGFAALDSMGLSGLSQNVAEISEQQTISSDDLLSQELPCCQEMAEPIESCCQEGP